MIYVYIIKSLFKNWHYVGFTTKLEARLFQHNNGNVRSTRFYRPFELRFVQLTLNTAEARKLEKYLKIRFNKEALLNILE